MTNLIYVKCGDYYIPDIELKEENSYGKYGRLREKFLKQNLNSLYTTMLLTETLNEHLCEIDAEAKRQVEQIISQIVCSEGVTKSVKSQSLPLTYSFLLVSAFVAKNIRLYSCLVQVLLIPPKLCLSKSNKTLTACGLAWLLRQWFSVGRKN